MGRVTIMSLGGGVEAHEHCGPFIDFLERVFPQGFGGQAAQVRLNGEVRAAETFADWAVTEGDEVRLALAPAGADPVSIAVVVVAAVVQTFLLVRLLTPAVPTFAQQEDPNTVYSVGAKANAAKLGAVIPVPFGRYTWTPDYAAESYAWFEGRQERRVFLLCVGQGDVDVEAVSLGATDARDLPEGSVRWAVYKPGDHGQVEGAVAAAFGCHENVLTSPDVSGQTLRSRLKVQAEVNVTMAGQKVVFNGDNADLADEAEIGDEVTINIFGDLSVTALVVAVDREAASITLDADVPDITRDVDLAIKSLTPLAVGGYVTPEAVERIELDVVWPQGLALTASDGALRARKVELTAEVTLINAAGDALAQPVQVVRSWSASSRTPKRETWPINLGSPELPVGRYRVRVWRSDFQNLANAIDETEWLRLKSYVAASAKPAYGDVTLLAIEVASSRELSARAQNEIKVTTQRPIAPFAGGEARPSSNIADVIGEIWSHAGFGAGQPRAWLSDIGFAEVAGLDLSGFNGVFDSRTTVFEAIKQVALLAYAKPVPQGQLLTLARDVAKPARASVVTPDLIVAGSFKLSPKWATVGAADGVEVTWYDSATGAERVARYPASASRPERQRLIGLTDGAEAEAMAEYLHLQQELRNVVVEFATEWDARTFLPFDRVGVCFPLFDWGAGAQVLAHDATSVTLDGRAKVPNGPCYVCLRGPDGVASDVYEAEGDGVRRLTFAVPPDFTFVAPSEGIATIAAWGEREAFLQDVTIDRVRLGGRQSRVEARLYEPKVYRSQLS